MLGTLATGLSSLLKLVIKLGHYGSQFYTYMVAAAPPTRNNLAAPPVNPHSVLVISRTEHTVTHRGSTKVKTTNIEFHHDPGQSLESGMDYQLNFAAAWRNSSLTVPNLFPQCCSSPPRPCRLAGIIRRGTDNSDLTTCRENEIESVS